MRSRFGGRVTYASLPFEGVDWRPFDIISTDAGYRSRELADRYQDDMRAFVALGRSLGKPVAITEFGCTTHRGAADKGGAGTRSSNGARGTHLDGDYTRDEAEQASCVRELLGIFAAEGVDAVFVNTFARYDLPHRSDPKDDLDMASYGVGRVLEGRLGDAYSDMAWEPKAAFAAVADRYGG